jgi:hypothetical protein
VFVSIPESSLTEKGSNRLIPLSVIHLVYVRNQVNSSDPPLAGTYATLTAEIHLTASLLVHVSTSLKPFLAVFEDENGLAYTESAIELTDRSGSGPALERRRQTDHYIRRYDSTRQGLGNLKAWHYGFRPVKGIKGRKPRRGGNRLANSADGIRRSEWEEARQTSGY